MKKKRLIPLLLLKDGLLVRSQKFQTHQIIGNPMSTVKRYMDWGVDELILLDISDEKNKNDLRREDLYQQYNSNSIFTLLKEISKFCYVPLTFGGGIKSLFQIEKLLLSGADKVSINSAAFLNPKIIEKSSEKFGSQSIVVSIDVKKSRNGYNVFIFNGKKDTQISLESWIKKAVDFGAGEILINSIDRDGTAKGFDLRILEKISSMVKVPIILCGGAGKSHHFLEGFKNTKVSALCAANIFHFQELSYVNIKSECLKNKIKLREVNYKFNFFNREPKYKKAEGHKIIKKRLNKISAMRTTKNFKIRWCKKCVYPSISAAPLEFNDKGICTGCQMSEFKKKIPIDHWKKREKDLKKILKKKFQ